MKRLVLDTGILGALCHPRKNTKLAEWWVEKLRRGGEELKIHIPAIVDYELRRKLLHLSLKGSGKENSRSLNRLDEFCRNLFYYPLSTNALREAASFWAKLRNRGKPNAPEEALDGDVILAAQAREIGGVVITKNPRHLKELVPVVIWEDD